LNTPNFAWWGDKAGKCLIVGLSHGTRNSPPGVALGRATRPRLRSDPTQLYHHPVGARSASDEMIL